MKGPSGQNKAPQRPEERPERGEPSPWEELDLTEAAATWRKKAEALWKLSQRHEELASLYRRKADQAEQMAKFFDGTGDWPKL